MYSSRDPIASDRRIPEEPTPQVPPRILNPIQSFFAQANSREKRSYIAAYEQRRNAMPAVMAPVTLPEDILASGKVLGTWNSREFMATAWQVPEHPGIACRLSVNRTRLNPTNGAWLSGISWDELYRVKNECGFGDLDAIEVYPAESRLVNVANMRHLWVMEKPLVFGL